MLKRERFFDIDCAKGFAIILVVIGHIIARDYPIGDEWFKYIKQTIYAFHMPLFIFLSGWIFYYTYPKTENIKELFIYILKKAYRFLIPFFMMGLIIVLGKYILATFLFVDNPVSTLQAGMLNLIWNTKHSSVGFIWYVYVVFVFISITLIGLKLIKSEKILLLLLVFAIILKALRLPGYFYLNLIGCFYVYFILGCIAFKNKDKYYELINKYSYYYLTMAIIFLLSMFYTDISYFRFFTAIFAILAVHGIIKSNFANSEFLLNINKYTFSIYLFNVPFIGLSKAILLKFISWDGANFFIFLPILFLSGLFLPILFKKYFLSKIPILDNLTN